MVDETYMNTGYVDAKGNLKKGFVPMSRMAMFNDDPDRKSKWSDEMRQHKENRLIWLKQKLTETEQKLTEELEEWDRLRFSMFKEQLLMDIREDELHLEYKGVIPDVINDRCTRKCSKVFERYRKSLGETRFQELIDDVNVSLWGSVIVNDKTTGGGKL